MDKITIKIPKLGRVIQTRGEVTLLDLLKHNEIPIAHSCSGEAVCGFCRIRILEGFNNLHPVTEDEKRIIEKKSIPPDERLSCQVWVECDLTIETDYW